MAQTSQLPCDGDGICMLCKEKPTEEETLTCKTCVTPWHVNCLSTPPETLASTLQWQCPDCSPVTGDPIQVTVQTGVSGVSTASVVLIAAVRAIEADESLTEQEKAKRRQELMSGTACSTDEDDEKKKKKKTKTKCEGSDVLELLGGTFNCSFCMQLPERPVTTPCGHNFCLKCFQKWTGQGKKSCAKCRSAIPPKMASQPRINSTLVTAIRMAKLSKSIATGSSANVYHFVQNENRPDKAFTTDRAKKAGKANACSGKIFVTIPPDHFGPILAENDPYRNQGVLVGECWEDRMECRQWGAHLPHVAGIAGQSEYGSQSVALSGGYQDDEDHGEWFLYTGSGGRDLSGNKRTNKEQSFDQKFEKMNEALRVSCRKGYPVRVVRSHKEKRSSYAPETGVRYDGVYRIEKCWRKVGIQGFKVCRYLFVRCDNEPAPWTSDEHGDRPRPLPVIKELNEATDIYERREVASWDYDDEEDCWKWKISPPVSRKPVETGNPEDRKIVRRKIRQAQNTSVREKLLKEFSCLICRKVLNLPLTTPCAHNFCKPCLEGVFAGQTFVKERTCLGGRTLRAQKNIMKCPSCPTDISDFLKSPQINRELMNVIESLQRKTEETVEELSEEEIDVTDEKTEDMILNAETTESSEMLADGEKDVHKSQAEPKPKQTNKRRKTDGLDISSNLDGVDKSEKSAATEKPEDMTGITGTEAPNSEMLVDGKRSTTDENNENIAAEEKKPESANGETVENTVNGEETVKGGTEVPKTENNKPKSNGGVKTRSRKAEEEVVAADEGNNSPSSPLHVRSDDDFV